MCFTGAFARFEALSGIERTRFTATQGPQRTHLHSTTAALHPPLHYQPTSTSTQQAPNPVPAMDSTPMMSAAQLTQKLVALERDSAQYRVEMALYVDRLERRLEEVEKSLRRVPLRADVGGSYISYRNTVAGFSEYRPDHRALPPISTTPDNFPTPAPSSSPFVHIPAYPGTPYDGLQHSPRDGARPPRNMGSGETAAFLP